MNASLRSDTTRTSAFVATKPAALASGVRFPTKTFAAASVIRGAPATQSGTVAENIRGTVIARWNSTSTPPPAARSHCRVTAPYTNTIHAPARTTGRPS